MVSRSAVRYRSVARSLACQTVRQSRDVQALSLSLRSRGSRVTLAALQGLGVGYRC